MAAECSAVWEGKMGKGKRGKSRRTIAEYVALISIQHSHFSPFPFFLIPQELFLQTAEVL
jgi:hypothetical protein